MIFENNVEYKFTKINSLLLGVYIKKVISSNSEMTFFYINVLVLLFSEKF